MNSTFSPPYEVLTSEKLGRYVVAKRDLRAGETIFSDEPFVLGPNSESTLVCFNCYLPLLSKFVVCKNCAVAPVCPGEGCPDYLHKKWHTERECNFFKSVKLLNGLHPMTMVQNVGSLLALRAFMKRTVDTQAWQEFMQLETHLQERRGTSIWEFSKNTVRFIQSLSVIDDIPDDDLIQRICAAIDVNSFEVRGPPVPSIGCAEVLRGVYLKAALLAHDCVANTHMAINDNNTLVCHASVDIKKGEPIYYNYTDPLKGTSIRQQNLMIGKYFKCSCDRCSDATEMGTFMSSLMCAECNTGYVSRNSPEEWTCNNCKKAFPDPTIVNRIKCCMDKFDVLNKTDTKELEEYIRNVSLILSPNHYLLMDAKQRLAGVLRDTINREPRPTKKLIKRKLDLCKELLPVLETLCPGISRTKAITLYELHAAIVQLAKKMFDGRDLTGPAYLDELTSAEKYLKRSLEMLFIEPGNSPEGELCAKALEEYRALKVTMSNILDAIHTEGKSYVCAVESNGSDKSK
ncbi:SET domain-containing protein SmydA-8-like [Trichoplusia ni]|uniref:SET domain-containing protein SmydA-8-like n=1 Tax=Trichoplusia ni TaxID=7111 RepID=A0A7E5WZM3_TRINI|nr:SET domain-containing protein SmydA-8-like [Trichoplusia ni]